MKIYAHFGFTDFVLALGYLGHRIKDYFLPYGEERHGVRLPIADCRLPIEQIADCRLPIADCPESGIWQIANRKSQITNGGKSQIANRKSQISAEWRILFADTGQDTPTGGRIKALEQFIEGDTFLATYSDGLADLDLSALLAFHRSHGRLATLTAVRPYSQFGLLDLEETGRIARFREKPRLEDWVNGGFFVFERGVFDYLQPDSTLERDPFERLAADGEIFAYRHEGFWDCMDTYKDTEVLNQLWNTGQAPWRV
jgi:glucose-1-phosphate cytidylyltransferase